MGNKAVTLRNDGEYEYSTGKRLLLSIKLNSREQTLEAIEHARKECVKPSSVLASVFSYDDMVKKVHEYLTKKYSIQVNEHGPMRNMTPLEYAESINADESAGAITSSISDLQKSIQAQNKHKDVSVKKTKETLKSRQVDYDYTRKGVQPPPKVNEPKQEKVSVKEMMKNSKNPSDRALEAKMKLKAFQESRNMNK